MAVRIFKLISGELIIGKLVAVTPLSELIGANMDTVKLAETKNFTIQNPFTLHYTPQGAGLAPILGWCKPGGDAAAEFVGSTVLCEVMDAEAIGSPHQSFVDDYNKINSPILTVKPGSVLNLVQ